MHTSRQAGLAAFQALPILLIVGILSFTGWLVWHRHGSKNDQDHFPHSVVFPEMATKQITR